MTRKINLLVGGVAILCFVALVFVPWEVDKIEEKQEYTITDDLEIPRIEKTVDEVVVPPIEKPSKKSEIWFYSFFDWFGSWWK